MMATCFANYLELPELQPATQAEAELWSFGTNYALLGYICKHIFDHIESAEEHGVTQEVVLRRLSNDECKLLLRLEGPPFKSCYEAGSTILVAAVDCGVVKTAQRILRMGFSVNHLSAAPLGYALHTAVRGPRLEHRTNVYNFKRGEAAQLEVINVLLQYGADVTLKDQFGQTPLHIATTKGPDVVSAILNKKPDVNAQDKDGETPLHRAVHSVHYPEFVELLLAHGARVDIRDRRGETPLDILVARGGRFVSEPWNTNEAVIKLMEEHAKKSACILPVESSGREDDSPADLDTTTTLTFHAR
jgi:hypothetical protein